MKLKKSTFHFFLVLTSLLCLLLTSGFSSFIPATAAESELDQETTVNSSLPTISHFVQSLQLNSSETVTGVYIPNTFAFNVVQQPAGNPAYVSSAEDVITQFSMASNYGSIGLMAHNNLAGATFENVIPGQTIVVIYGDGSLDYYHITAVEKYQALSPTSPYSQFVNLDSNGATMSAEDLFMHVYANAGTLVLQTCIANGNQTSWGRMFILAEPIQDFQP
jgi:hypothetical protein